MESVFCLEVAIDGLKLRRRVKCGIPYVAISFLQFPTIIIHTDNRKHEVSNEYAFGKGKSCLFKMSTTKLYKELMSTPLYIVVLDEVRDEKGQEYTIGAASVDLRDTIKEIVGDLQTNGIHKTSCHGDITTVTITNFMQSTVGCIDIAYKLTSLGHSMLPHLPIVLKDDVTKQPVMKVSKPETNKLSSIENVICPPALYYDAKPSKVKRSMKSAGNEDKSFVDDEKAKAMEKSKDELFLERENTLKHLQRQNYISLTVPKQLKCESTQTNLNHLDQFPILQGLIEEVLQLGLNWPGTSSKHTGISEEAPKSNEQFKPRSISQQMKSTIVIHKPERDEGSRSIPVSKGKKQEKRKYPLQYGLTRSHMLRTTKNRQPDASSGNLKKSKKGKRSQNSEPSKKKIPLGKTAMTLMSPIASEKAESTAHVSTSEAWSHDDDNRSVELNISEMNLKTVDDFTPTLETGSPRAQSRQSIEVRLPMANHEEMQEDSEYSEGEFKYSDDFDEERTWSYERTPSGLTTTLDSSRQATPYDISRENSLSPHRSLIDMSPYPTISEYSQTISFGITPRDSIPEEPEKELHEEENNDNVLSEASDRKVEVPLKPISELSPRNDSQNDDDSKPTDDSASASVVTTLMTAKLPKPAPSSDSPVIRSLASEPRSRKPRPPTVSHSSSFEHVNRKFRRSTESSLHMSDFSDIRTSDLADIKTSDISDLRTSDEGISPVNSTDFLVNKIALPKLAKRFSLN